MILTRKYYISCLRNTDCSLNLCWNAACMYICGKGIHWQKGKAFAVSEGILVGISSGAAVKAAVILAHRPENGK